jgi:DNA-binding response OmpR family regulator
MATHERVQLNKTDDSTDASSGKPRGFIRKMQKAPTPYNPQTMTILVIDDQDPIRKAIRRILLGMGFGVVLESFDGSDAAKILAKVNVDLVIADIYMRKVSGFQILKKIRNQNFGADIPVIMVTGEGSKEDIVKAADLGADDYILKPFHIADIEKKVAAVLTKYHIPTPLLKLLRQGDRLSLQGHLADALKLFEAAERLDPQSPRAKFSKAVVMDKMGQHSEALSLLEESAASNSTYYKNYAAIGDILLAMNQKGKAIEAFKNELELNPKQPARQILLANLLISEGDFLGAIHHFREALKESPKSKDALLGMGRAYENSGNDEKAVYYYRRARRQHPTLTKALELIVQLYESQKSPRGAIVALLDEVHQNQGRSDARVLLANLYVKHDDLASGLKILDEGISRDPQNVVLLKSKGKILLNANDTTNACLIFKRVVALDPIDKHYMLLGLALMHDRQYPEAYESLFSALHSTDERQKVLTLIAEVLKRMGNPAQAITILQMARQTNGSIPSATLTDDIKALMPEVLRKRSINMVKKTG